MEEEERRTSEGCGETDGKVPAKEKVRIGIAKDEAFCFFYQENLKILEDMGAELVYFSSLSSNSPSLRLSFAIWLFPKISISFLISCKFIITHLLR